MNDITYVGLDVHKATVCVAIDESGRGGAVRQAGVFDTARTSCGKWRLGLARIGVASTFATKPVLADMDFTVTGLGHDCIVVAPSLIPMRAGGRVKTDRRDALMLV